MLIPAAGMQLGIVREFKGRRRDRVFKHSGVIDIMNPNTEPDTQLPDAGW